MSRLHRTYWKGFNLNRVEPLPLWISFIKYRHKNDRRLTKESEANLVSSRALCGRHLPILDLDGPHTYVPSSTAGHAHLYLDHEISTPRWIVLMIGLRVGGVIDPGFFMWSLRRGANFVRPEGIKKVSGSPSS